MPTSKPKFLVIGLEGAAKTVIEGTLDDYGWTVANTAVIASLTFRKARYALYVSESSSEVRVVDVLVRDNATASYAAGVHVQTAAKVHVVGSTFLDNVGFATAQQIWVGSGVATLTNTVVSSGATSGTMLAKHTNATLTTNYCLVKGQTLSGTGNLAGTSDPKFRPDAHLLWDSPLRGAGGSVAQSRIDIDGELRPSSARDIGVDQFVDSDADDLADHWELTHAAGVLTTLTSRTQDADSDGLSNDAEYANITNPTVADTDGDGLSDGDEVNVHSSNPLSTDSDGDDMPDAWEVAHGLAPSVANAFDDADGDRYPNIYEYAGSTDPDDASSKPTPTFVVDVAGGGTHTTVSAAITAANVSNGAYQIIGIAPGVYTGTANGSGVHLPTSKPKFLVIGLEGAENTVIESLNDYGWTVANTAVIASLTFRKSRYALYVSESSSEVRVVDLVVRDNVTTSFAAGVHVQSAAKVHIVGSTFLNNVGFATAEQIYIGGNGAATITNTVVWGATSGTMLAKASSATLTTNYCLAKGQTLSGTGNLAGTLDPKFRPDLRLRSDSPLRGAGGSVAQSRIDIDGELRPSSAPDIGVDQFNDADADGLPDGWEIARYGNTTTVSGAADNDSDGLNNIGEYDWESDPFNSDTDRDGVNDGDELVYGMNPVRSDSDELETDLNGDGLIDSIGAQLGYSRSQVDNDGDSVTNSGESLMCTNILRPDTDGDGVLDDADAFPLDPLMSALPSNSQDVTPPIITLTAPWYAVEQ